MPTWEYLADSIPVVVGMLVEILAKGVDDFFLLFSILFTFPNLSNRKLDKLDD